MPRTSNDNIDHFFDHDIDLTNRTIYMGSVHGTDDGDESGTDYAMAEHMIKGLHLLEARNSDPIKIIMNNVGGDEYHGLAIFDAIRACKSDVTVEVYGHAMSMGSIILQAADYRYMAPNSKMMIHYGTWGHYGHPKISEKWMEEGKRMNKWMINLYLEKIREKHPKFTYSKVDKMCNFDTFFSAEEAVEIGLADEVL